MGDTEAQPKLLAIIAGSKSAEILLTLIVYTIYAAVVATSLVPSSFLLITATPSVIDATLAGSALRGAVVLASALAGALYLYLFTGALVQATLVRLLSLGIHEGRYPAVSLTTLRWLIYSGVYTISVRTVLPLIPVSFLINLYFRIVGCRMGRNVKLNSYNLNDAHLLTIGDDVIVGGQTDVSCHLFEHDHLVLRPISIGSGTLIGAHSYVSPGVTIGRKCIIGLSSYIRMGREIPDGSTITSLAGIDVKTARHIERGHVVGVRGPAKR
ncbi:MAG: DapH/DapD/GlmU-related protein [Spirochaetota bacterium]